MRPWNTAVLIAAGLAVGCMAGSPATSAPPAPGAPPPRAAVPASARSDSLPPARLPVDLLLLDRTDLRIGVTAQYGRIPDPQELSDLRQTLGLAHVVLVLPDWPGDYESLAPLEQLPPEADAIVLLPGYPPSREAADAWNLVHVRLRIVLLVLGPPPSATVVQDLNSMRGLERVIAQMDLPSRAGFERLQRPLSFRKLMD